MRFNFEITIRHILISLAIALTGFISFISGKLIYETRPSYTETITKTVTHTIKEPITITGGYVIEPSIGVVMIVGIVMFSIIIAKSWN